MLIDPVRRLGAPRIVATLWSISGDLGLGPVGRLHRFANGTRAKLMIAAVAILLVVGAVTAGSLLRGAPAA